MPSFSPGRGATLDQEDPGVDDRDFLRGLGRAIRTHRRNFGLTQEQLAEIIGSSSEWMSQVERGVGTPSVAILLRVAEAVGTTPLALIDAAWGASPEDADLHEVQMRARRLPPAALRVLRDTARALERELVPESKR